MTMTTPPTPPATMTPPMPTMAPPPDLHHLLLRLIPMHQRQHSRKEKEHAVHNPKRPARLQHATRLINVQIQRIQRRAAQNPKADISLAPPREIDAVVVLDETEVVDACDKGADETEVDDTDEAGVGGGAMVGEEGEEGPGEGEDRDDEEDQDVGGREEVGVVVDGNEVGEHADCGDQREDLEEAPEGEEDGEEHCCGCALARALGRGVRMVVWC